MLNRGVKNEHDDRSRTPTGKASSMARVVSEHGICVVSLSFECAGHEPRCGQEQGGGPGRTV